jgi:hypothetical protein
VKDSRTWRPRERLMTRMLNCWRRAMARSMAAMTEESVPPALVVEDAQVDEVGAGGRRRRS